MADTKTPDRLRLEFRAQILVPMVTGLVAASAALAGTWLSFHLSSQSSRDIQQREAAREVIAKRLELIDRTSTVFGCAPGISDMWHVYLSKLRPSVTIQGVRYAGPVGLADKLGQYKADYDSVLMMDAVLFGPDTNKAIAELGRQGGPWWEKSRDKTNAVLTAMTRELGYALPANRT